MKKAGRLIDQDLIDYIVWVAPRNSIKGGLALQSREDHAAYIESWLRGLKNDRWLIFQAAAMPSGPVPSCTAIQR